MSKEIAIKLPKHSKDLRIEHFKCFEDYDDFQMEVFDKVKFVASFLGRSENFVWSIEKTVFDKTYDHIIKLISGLNPPAKPPQEITIDGMVYELIDPAKAGIGWHQDWSMQDMKKDPVKVACLFYHPKGHYYGEIDRNDNLIHPIRWKREKFEKEFPLELFISCARFFLQNWLESTMKSTRIKIAEKKAEKLIKRLPSFLLKKPSIS
jgi:hypothetical protein